MSSILLLLQTVHQNVHQIEMKPNFSKPLIYTGGQDINQWNKLSKKEKEVALSKDWYVYFKFRNPETGKLVRQANIKAGANRIKTKEERYKFLSDVRDNLELLLKMGFNPYDENKQLEEKLTQNKTKSDNKNESLATQITISIEKENVESVLSIQNAFNYVLNIKEKTWSKSSYPVFKSRVNRFLIWLDGYKKDYSKQPITELDKNTVIIYLNEVLEKTSASNRNNTRADLSALFQTLVDDDIITENFIKNISVTKSKPQRNKSYSSKQESDLLEYLEKNDPILLLFIQFITYNFLRPIEVCRLKVGDLNLKDKTLTVDAKNKLGKTKLIPQKLIDLLPDLSLKNHDDLVFTPTEFGGKWETLETNRRDYFTKKFKEIKDEFKLDKNYGLYSFRHTSISNLYRELSKTLTPFETKSRLMQITGHQTMDALEKYLRDIDAALPEDYSSLLK
ncbi:tyrosine-type recombinase/integrase [Flavobacterium lacus]|uniref:Site-specific recombinase XerD n=1 Tax=Flavobacterium lacus TaxID=1353778 RepID=A0A328X6U2_9FLAO|nr:site-specific integrase [Flavobacterium lacus]RAR51058.1 site-specific recombinase XerD [Flavobacterium lacus]